MKKLLLIASVFLSISLWAKEFNVENRVNELLKATAQKNYVEFIKSGSTEFKNLDKKEFEKVANQLAPKINEGMKLLFLTDLKKGEHVVHLYKVSFKNEDALVRIVLNEKYETLGFWIQ